MPLRRPAMRGLTIVVATEQVDRYRTALSLAAAQAAAGGTARLFLNERAASLLGAPAPLDDVGFASAGLPTLAQLQEEALALGVRLIVCQSGLALVGIHADSLDPRIETGGLVGIVTSLDGDRLTIA